MYYNERLPYSRRREETEAAGTICPRCGLHLEYNRSRDGVMFYCSNCGFHCEESDRSITDEFFAEL